MPASMVQALFAKDIAKLAEKRGVSSAQSSAVGTIIGMALDPYA